MIEKQEFEALREQVAQWIADETGAAFDEKYAQADRIIAIVRSAALEESAKIAEMYGKINARSPSDNRDFAAGYDIAVSSATGDIAAAIRAAGEGEK